MMKTEMSFSLPDGFRLIRREKILPIQDAQDLLLTRKKRNITSADRQGDEARIVWHVIECPFCRSRLPACRRYMGKPPAVSRQEIMKWAEPQYSLFSAGTGSLTLNAVRDPKEVYSCPRCGRESRPFRQSRTIRLTAETGKVTVSCPTADLKSILELMKRTRILKEHFRFPLKEILELNLRNGHACIRIVDSEDDVAAVLDVTYSGGSWSGSAIFRVLETSDLAKRKMRRAFALACGGEPPFETGEFTPRNLVAMTRFQGFPRAFYDSVPYDLLSGAIEPGFKPVMKRIRKTDDLIRAFRRSRLPNAKCLRRVLFSNPGLFFYLPELEELWTIVSELNCFTRILESENAFVVLSFLHQYPAAFSFVRDYREVKGAVGTASFLIRQWPAAVGYVLRYSSMRGSAKKEESGRWKTVRFFWETQQEYSIPMHAVSERIVDCVIDGFSFEWLRARSDYVRAGHELNNCLGEWTPGSNPVVIIKQKSRTLAAVELDADRVVQVRAEDNAFIGRDEMLYRAYKKWIGRFSLIDSYESFDFDAWNPQ